jgi:ATP-binding cassette subfamily F protein 3
LLRGAGKRNIPGFAMLTLSGISKSFAGRTLFDAVGLQVNRGDRIGLVGPNGAGKSTLFSLVLGDATPDEGSIAFQRGFTTGHLPQESAPVGEQTVLELAISVSEEVVELQKKIHAWENEHPDESDEIDHNIHARFDELGGYQLEPKAKRILGGLSFRTSDFDRPLKEMSGGWVMRAYLARLLVMSPDLLMLDEPTNHLDLESLIWLQEYLRGYDGAILLISHDREFLNELIGSTVEIRHAGLVRYRGNYDSYLVQRKAKDEQQLAAYDNQQREIQSLMAFVNRFRAKNTKAAQAQSKLKQIERMEKLAPPPRDDRKISFGFPQPERSGLRAIRLTDIHQAYGANKVYEGMDFEAERGEKIVLVGPNGAGKSTLLKILAGVLKFQTGEREPGHNTRVGYFSQYRTDTLSLTNSVLAEALSTAGRVTEESVRSLLGCFLFTGDDVFKQVGVLSGGEKSRLALVKILLDPPNLLLMDEPTTHLDMASIEAIIEALRQYSGTLIFISHDVYFIRQLGTKVVHVNSGKLTHYAGDYQYYLEKTSAESARIGLTVGLAGQASAKGPAKQVKRTREEIKAQKRREAEERQKRSKGRKDAQQAVYDLEKRIERLEAKQAELTTELENPETYENAGKAVQVNRELADVTRNLGSLTPQWEKAAAKLETIE